MKLIPRTLFDRDLNRIPFRAQNEPKNAAMLSIIGEAVQRQVVSIQANFQEAEVNGNCRSRISAVIPGMWRKCRNVPAKSSSSCFSGKERPPASMTPGGSVCGLNRRTSQGRFSVFWSSISWLIERAPRCRNNMSSASSNERMDLGPFRVGEIPELVVDRGLEINRHLLRAPVSASWAEVPVRWRRRVGACDPRELSPDPSRPRRSSGGSLYADFDILDGLTLVLVVEVAALFNPAPQTPDFLGGLSPAGLNSVTPWPMPMASW